MSKATFIFAGLVLSLICSAATGTTIHWESLYPDEAARECIEGEVTLTYEVGPESLPVDIQVVASEPEGVFDQTAVRALSRWTQSDPRGTLKRETIEFRIDDHSECNS
ncbi:TonB family protein [Wenzhouxiangella sp. EGI_FJ10409]|uniref:TonB family protein n=1 Tax=Wenzhouxiangella sp. EGI_FJ10409 TaxID=3243767 RepID=UPI0035D741B4